jgi:hypothetical protein
MLWLTRGVRSLDHGKSPTGRGPANKAGMCKRHSLGRQPAKEVVLEYRPRESKRGWKSRPPLCRVIPPPAFRQNKFSDSSRRYRQPATPPRVATSTSGIQRSHLRLHSGGRSIFGTKTWHPNMSSCLGICFTCDVKSTPKDSFLGLFSTPNSTPNMMSICVPKIHPKMDSF